MSLIKALAMVRSELGDIRNREDIKCFVDLFYDRIRQDESLGPIFNGIVQLEWESHLELMYRFWDSVLFGAGSYKGNPLAAHLAVNENVRKVRGNGMQQDEFSHWLKLFRESLDQLFIGPVVERAKRGAMRMATHLAEVCSDDYVESPLPIAPELR